RGAGNDSRGENAWTDSLGLRPGRPDLALIDSGRDRNSTPAAARSYLPVPPSELRRRRARDLYSVQSHDSDRVQASERRALHWGRLAASQLGGGGRCVAPRLGVSWIGGNMSRTTPRAIRLIALVTVAAIVAILIVEPRLPALHAFPTLSAPDPALAGAHDELPRKGYLGVRLAPLSDGARARQEPGREPGVLIEAVIPDTTAA